MKENRIVKNMSELCSVTGTPDEEALALISRFARKMPDAKDIYTFSVILCDNEIDRDNERFSLSAIETLKDMFVGVTGIFDHSMKSTDQTARIYKTEILRDETKFTLAGEVYTCLKAWCYMLRTEKNSQLISEIDGGIKKEVSISCSVAEKLCSECGNDIRSRECNHISGEKTSKGVCHHILTNPTDAYEWSFVAVPAQRNAGVSKSLKKDRHERIASRKPEEIIKTAIEKGTDVTLSPVQMKAFADYVCEMQDNAALGADRRVQAEKEIIALSAFTLPDADCEKMKGILSRLTGDEVMMLHKAFGDRAEKLQVFTSDFATEKTENKNDNSQFRI